jgi:tetratricopeptide (TPR) repeat protein
MRVTPTAVDVGCTRAVRFRMRAGQGIVRTALVFSTIAALGPLGPSLAHAKRKPKGKAPAAAAPVEAGPSAEAKEAARAAYGRGQAAFSGGQFATAKLAFQEAFDAVPNPIVLLSIAESEMKLEQFTEAVVTWQRYLELKPDAADRADIETKIKTLAAMPAMVSVTSEPSGAALDLDGLPTQRTTPVQLELAPGEHTIDYSLAGHRSGSETLSVKAGEKRQLRVSLEALPAAPVVAEASVPVVEPQPASQPAQDAASSGPPTTAIWVTAGVGAAGLIAGSVFGLLAVGAHSDFDEKPSAAAADRGERYALFADVGFGVGIIALSTAAVLYFTADDEGSPETAKLEFAPEVTPTSLAARAQLSF